MARLILGVFFRALRLVSVSSPLFVWTSNSKTTMDPISVGVSAVFGIAATYAFHGDLKCLNIIPTEVSSLSDECSRLENTLRHIQNIGQQLQSPNLSSSSGHDHLTIVPALESVLLDTHMRLSDLQYFVKYTSKKAKENSGGDHWEWLRKKNNIDKLRAELRAIRYDLAVRLGVASPEHFSQALFVEQHKHEGPIHSLPDREASLSSRRAKIDDFTAAHDTWAQLDNRYREIEGVPSSCEHQCVRSIHGPTLPELEACCTVVEPSTSSIKTPHWSCFDGLGRICPSCVLWVLKNCSSIRTCYILIALGALSIAGSLALALWRSLNHSDLSGGFALAQYVLAVGALIIGCVLVIHSRTCCCWLSSMSTSRNRSPHLNSTIELQQSRNSEPLAR